MLGAQPWPDQRHANIDRCSNMARAPASGGCGGSLMSAKMPTTVLGVATALKRNPEVVAAMKEAGWDIASHSLKWIEHKNMSEAEERGEIAEAIRVHTEATGARPLGWYTGRSSINTLRLLMAGGLLYLCDSYADDLPYWIKAPASEPHLVIPYTLDANDMRFVNPQGSAAAISSSLTSRTVLMWLYAEGETSPRMMSVGLHCRLVGRPGRAAALMRFRLHRQNTSASGY